MCDSCNLTSNSKVDLDKSIDFHKFMEVKPHLRPYYISTPIYYTSARLHIGNTYCTVLADTIARYKRLRGYDVYFLTGTDEHGQKIAQKAKEAGQDPRAFVDDLVADTKRLWEMYNISYDYFIRTTDDHHKNKVQAIFQTLYDKGDIYKGEYEGWYCTPCESFWTETQLLEGKKCPDCGRSVDKTHEESYFFRLSKYEDRLKEWYSKQPEAIAPPSRANEMIKNFLNQGLSDLSVSRKNFSWGVKVPFDPKHVIYVWIDALSNYITALNFPSNLSSRENILDEAFSKESIGQLSCGAFACGCDTHTSASTSFKKFWPCDLHLVGKEIFRFHAIIWPALLMALELPLPKQIFGHGWILFDNDKMSKSKGNIIDPRILAKRYTDDAVRYFLLREGSMGSDFSYTSEKLINRINSDLANDLGNLLSRTIAMINKYFAKNILSYSEIVEKIEDFNEYDQELLQLLIKIHKNYCEQMDKLELNQALATVFKLISRANKYIDETTPWLLAKDESKKTYLAFVLYQLLEVLARSAYYLLPFMPVASQKILENLDLNFYGHIEFFEVENTKFRLVNKVGDLKSTAPLFPRLDLEVEQEYLASCQDKQKTDVVTDKNTEIEQTDEIVQLKNSISFDDFSKLDLRVAEILACEKVKNADKLLKIEIKVGKEQYTVLSGIALYYLPEELINKKVIWVANLTPKKMRGILSHGMLLCSTSPTGEVKLVEIDKNVPSGSIIS